MVKRHKFGRIRCAVGASACLAAMIARPLPAEVIHVPDDYPTIQAAILNAQDGDEIIVAAGEYFERIDLLGKALTVRSTDPDDPEIVAATIINGEGLGPVVTCTTDEEPDTVLSGFTITNGHAPRGGGLYTWSASPTVTHCVFTANAADEVGGGMYSGPGNPQIARCTFRGNSAVAGGGMCGWNDSNAVFTRCVFSENAAYNGAGLCGRFCSLTANECSFRDNVAEVTGGGLLCYYASAVVSRCTFTENEAAFGAGMAHESNVVAAIVNCTLRANRATEAGGGIHSQYDGNVNAIGCLFVENRATGGAAIAQHDDHSMSLRNCTLTRNSASAYGGGLDNYCSHPVITNCVLWDDNGGEIIDRGDSTSHVSYCDVQGGYQGAGNVDADPLFVDPENGDWRLSPGSPCIDAGVNNALAADALDLDGDGDTAERFPLDLDDHARFADDPDTADTGCGAPVIVDMGAHEFSGAVWHPMRIGDIDGDGDVDTADLLTLLGDMGAYEDECVLADLDYSGQVDIEDLLTLLANWG